MNGNSFLSKIGRNRLLALFTAFCVLCAVFAVRLFYLQIYDESIPASASAFHHSYKSGILHATRGDICDCNGKVLAMERESYDLILNRTTLENGKANETLLALIALLKEQDITLAPQCPLTAEYPYALDPDYLFDAQSTRGFEKFLSLHELEKTDVVGEAFYERLVRLYDIPEEHKTESEYRTVACVRYDMEVNDFSVTTPYVLLHDVSESLKIYLSERLHTLHGVEFGEVTERYYPFGSSLCHVLGRVGPIYAEEAEEYIQNKGYAYGDKIGKEGAERVFEEYLHSTDGVALYEFDENNDVQSVQVDKEAIPGRRVKLSIDIGMQEVAEKALAREIRNAVAYAPGEGGYHTGEDCKKGAAVVLSVKTGEIITSASCPGYDLNTFSEDFSSLSVDSASPLLNRVTFGLYPPGSTFKVLTAAAALDSGAITPNTHILDKGEYTKYAPTYTPHCWIYLRHGTTHGYVNVSDAIKVSCNYFFYSVADMMGVDTIVEYAKEFGLGVKTGVELPESSGILASPEYRDSIGSIWNPGDTLQMAIGQSDHAFTPLQLASYMSAVVGGGNRYRTTILSEVDDAYTGEVIYRHEPEVLSTTHLEPETVSLLKNAMRSVVGQEEGTARNVFQRKSYVSDIGGKTGTAEVTGGSDTVLFVGFAPFDDPEIVVVTVVENGYASARAASVAADIFDYYYSQKEEQTNG